MSKLNERKIIKIFQSQLNNKKFVPEDVEVFKVGKKTNCVIKVDTLVESTDVPPKTNLRDISRKSLVACVSDFASKGVKPLYGIVSLTVPRKFSRLQIKDLAVGLALAAREFDVKILGGDTNEGKELVMHVSLFGLASKIIPRSGAKINDVLITTGPFGYSAAGLKIILDKKKKIKTSKKFATKSKKATLKPIPKWRFGLKCGKYLSSSMDSSDGLAITLHELARQSQKQFVITKLPARPDLIEFALKNKQSPLDLIFRGGEEYEIVATVTPKKLARVKRCARAQKISLFEMGYVTRGSGVLFKSADKTLRIKDVGWIHFED